MISNYLPKTIEKIKNLRFLKITILEYFEMEPTDWGWKVDDGQYYSQNNCTVMFGGGGAGVPHTLICITYKNNFHGFPTFPWFLTFLPKYKVKTKQKFWTELLHIFMPLIQSEKTYFCKKFKKNGYLQLFFKGGGRELQPPSHRIRHRWAIRARLNTLH